MKRIPVLQPLSREHHAALSLASRLRKRVFAPGNAALEETAREVVRFFHDALAPHFEEEERWLLPALAEADAAVRRTLEEHARLRHLVTRLGERPVEADLAAFAALLADHVRFEERELFEQYQAACGPEAARAA